MINERKYSKRCFFPHHHPPPTCSYLFLLFMILCAGVVQLRSKRGVKSDERGQEVPAGEWNAVAYLGPKCHRNYQKMSNKAKIPQICKLILIINGVHNLGWYFRRYLQSYKCWLWLNKKTFCVDLQLKIILTFLDEYAKYLWINIFQSINEWNRLCEINLIFHTQILNTVNKLNP